MKSIQQYNTEQAVLASAWLRLDREFPEGAKRSSGNRWQNEFAQYLHGAMGWRPDHEDRY